MLVADPRLSVVKASEAVARTNNGQTSNCRVGGLGAENRAAVVPLLTYWTVILKRCIAEFELKVQVLNQGADGEVALDFGNGTESGFITTETAVLRQCPEHACSFGARMRRRPGDVQWKVSYVCIKHKPDCPYCMDSDYDKYSPDSKPTFHQFAYRYGKDQLDSSPKMFRGRLPPLLRGRLPQAIWDLKVQKNYGNMHDLMEAAVRKVMADKAEEKHAMRDIVSNGGHRAHLTSRVAQAQESAPLRTVQPELGGSSTTPVPTLQSQKPSSESQTAFPPLSSTPSIISLPEIIFTSSQSTQLEISTLR